MKAAIEALVERVRAAPGAPATVELRVDLDPAAGPSPARHDAGVEDAVYRLVQEATTNVLKHAHAGRVDISVLEREGAIEVCVRDDGRGFDPRETGDGFGLVGMRERLALISGTLAVSSHPGGGTEVHAIVPSGRHEPGLAHTA